MLATKKSRQPSSKAKAAAKPAAKATTGPVTKVAKATGLTKVTKTGKPRKPASETLTLTEVMRTLEQAGSEQTRKTYTRHGATGPMFGVSFGTLGALQKRIRVDHQLALQLWETGNVDARNLAMKIADPAVISAADLERWARENCMAMCALYIASLAQESPHWTAKAKAWLAAKDAKLRATGWTLIAVLANRDERSSDDTYAGHLQQIERAIHTEANQVKYAMNNALIAIGGRSAALRKAATAAAKRIGAVDVDHGDTSCKTPDAVPYIDKMWERSGKKFASPAAAERARESMRTRC